LSWRDVFGLALRAGIGFTVSLLIGELAFGPSSARDDHVKIGVGCWWSLVSALLATVVLRLRNRHYRWICAEEERDDDADGVPDVYRAGGSPG
jgi:NhaA family Na+:H+ antiporter